MAFMQNVDYIIEAEHIVPVRPQHTVLSQHALVINKGVIVDICPQSQARQQYAATETLKLAHHVLMPGMVNLHAHAAMTLFRGLADDLPLMQWLNEHIWPAEKKWVSHQFVYDGSLLACAEMLSGGVTTFNDMYFYPQATIDATTKLGMRAHIGLVVIDVPTGYAENTDDYIRLGTETRDVNKHLPNITYSFAPHAPYTVNDKTFDKLVVLAEQLGLGLHTHLHETVAEIEQGVAKDGQRPLNRLKQLGVLGNNTVLAHCVHLNEQELLTLAEYGCHVAHCPSSNLKLASGIAPVAQMLQQQINVGLGTDGAASNNRLDMWQEMRQAALLAKVKQEDATAVSAFDALEMATYRGAKALDLDDKIGSLEVGKMADIVAVDLSELTMMPCFNPISQLVYVAGREQVSHVWVAGELKYHKPQHSQGVYAEVEPAELRAISSQWKMKLQA